LSNEVKPDLAILDLMMEEHDDGFILSPPPEAQGARPAGHLVTAVNRRDGEFSFKPSAAAERAWVGADAFLAKPSASSS